MVEMRYFNECSRYRYFRLRSSNRCRLYAHNNSRHNSDGVITSTGVGLGTSTVYTSATLPTILCTANIHHPFSTSTGTENPFCVLTSRTGESGEKARANSTIPCAKPIARSCLSRSCPPAAGVEESAGEGLGEEVLCVVGGAE